MALISRLFLFAFGAFDGGERCLWSESLFFSFIESQWDSKKGKQVPIMLV